jgi:hypothetical protein
MIIKKESVCKKTGDIKTHFTTDKKGWKVVMREGEPQEVKMKTDERINRDHGAKTDGKGAVGSSNKQRGITRINKEAETLYNSKKENVPVKEPFAEQAPAPISRMAKKVEILSNKLKKAKLDYMAAMLDKKSSEIAEKEKYYKEAEKYMIMDRKKLKDKNNFFVQDQEEHKENIKKDVDAVEKVELPKNETGEMKPVKEAKKDILSRIKRVLGEADEEEKDKEDDKKEDEGGLDLLSDIESSKKSDEEGDKEDAGEDESADEDEDKKDEEDTEDEEKEDEKIIAPDNEIKRFIIANKFDVDANNAYDFYDFISDKLTDQIAIKALNTEYEAIPENRRKVTSARELFDRVSKKAELMNKKEADNLNKELSPEGGGEEGGGEEGGGEEGGDVEDLLK